MANITNQFEYRLGVESTSAYGTAVAQTIKLMNIESLDLTPMIEGMQIKDMRGTQAPGHQSVLNRVSAEASMSGWLNIEQAPYWFNSLLQDVVPTTDVSGGTWSWAAPGSDGLPDVNSFTIAKGISTDAGTVKSIRGAVVRDVQISGEVNQPLRMTANFVGLAVDTDTFDSDAEADVTTQILRGCDISLWIDPDSDTIGTTAISATGFDFDLNINSNRGTFGHLGNCVDDSLKEARFEGSLRLGLENNATSQPYLDTMLTADTTGLVKKVVRILAQVDTDNYIQFDFNGVALETPQLFTDRDGVSTIEMTLTGQYGAVLGNWFKVEARNAVDAF